MCVSALPDNVQVNIQLGSLTVNTSRLEALDDRIMRMEDFQEVFGKDCRQVQCAPVKITSMRLWYVSVISYRNVRASGGSCFVCRELIRPYPKVACVLVT